MLTGAKDRPRAYTDRFYYADKKRANILVIQISTRCRIYGSDNAIRHVRLYYLKFPTRPDTIFNNEL